MVNQHQTQAENGEELPPAEAAEASEPPVAEEAEAAQPAEPEITLESLQQELDKARDVALRATAEAQNVRRRAEQDIDKARKFALENFANELLPVVDNLERAFAAASGGNKGSDNESGKESSKESLQAIAEGVELTLKSLTAALGKFNIEAVAPQPGEPFDPNLHEPMTLVPNGDMEPNSVIEVMQRGYTLSGRLLRPARVVVSKAPQ